MSNNLIGRLGLQPALVDRPLVVSNPVGGSASLSMICLGVELSSHDRRFVCDLFALSFEGFGIILGMDWLGKYGAVLDCDRRLVTLGDEEGRKLELYCAGESPVMVSYLYSLDLPGGELASVPIAREYPNVFEEVVGLPPH
ncbi:hypothetical protein, partial [Pseudomonas aeruginosa]|uniref:hypothetical protein n=1 Tax=Pseudomonas aeruginosa TaxID=287 RepID=UPI00359F5FB8